MKIFNAKYNLIDGLTPKVIETSAGFLLNTQYYLKNNLSPVPFESTRIYGAPYHLNLYKSLYCTSYSWNRKNIEKTIIQDTYIPNRSYVMTHSGYVSGTRALYLSVIDEVNTKCTLVKDVISLGDCQFVEYVYQTEQYLYFTMTSNKTWYLVRYDKIANTSSNVINIGNTYAYPDPLLLYTDASHFYFAVYIDNSIRITQYDVMNNTNVTASTYRGQMTTTGNYNCSIMMQKVELSPTEFGVYCYNLGEPTQPLGIYSVDVAATFNSTWETACKYTPCTITWNADKAEIAYNATTHSVSTYYRIFFNEVNQKKYLHVCVHSHNFENVSYIPYQGIYTFEIVSNTSFKFLHYNRIDNTQQINGYLFDDEFKICIVAINRGFKIIKFSEIEEQFVDTGIEITSVYDVGLDEAGRLWYLKLDGSVNLVNLSDAQDVSIAFEKEYYEYTGKNISTYITFSAKTYTGDEAKGTFQLTIEGPAIFANENSKQVQFSYTGEKQFDILITGASPITIYPKYINE